MKTTSNLPQAGSFAVTVISIIVALTLTLFIGITLLGKYWPDIQEYRYRVEGERIQKLIDNEKKRITDLEKADTYGGKTPEETFDMFLDALKKNDINLASKYYDVRVQEKALEGLKSELTEKGNLEMSIKYFTDVRGGKKGCSEIDTSYGGCTFTLGEKTTEDEYIDILGSKVFIPKGETMNKTVGLHLNHQSNFWKISE